MPARQRKDETAPVEPTEEQQKRAAYSEATSEMRKADPEKFKGFLKAAYEKRGLAWNPRLTPAERARKDLEKILAEHPELKDEITA